MWCSACNRDNPADTQSCLICGGPLISRCARCRATLAADARFCSQCGARVTTGDPADEAADAAAGPVSPGAGERRHLTVLFSDVVDSTELAVLLDPEEWRELVSDYQRAAAAAVTRFGGHVAKFLGDGLLVYFGYPLAHENDPERAVYAGLAIIEGIRALNERPNADDRPLLRVRVGIHAGSVVVGESAGGETDIFGDSPNIAARIQAIADPGTVLISAATQRLTAGLFAVEERGAMNLKGLPEPLELFRVTRPSGVRMRLDRAAVHGLTPFIGREAELETLWRAWTRARAGERQSVLIIGEGGIGKSRLVRQFRQRLRATARTWAECGTSPFFENTPFYAVVELLRQRLATRADRSDERRVKRLERAIANAEVGNREAVPLIARLMGLTLPERYPPLFLPPEQERRRQLAALAGWATALARQRPFVIVTEDLHWADPSTLELLRLLREDKTPAPILLVFTTRPEFKPPWPARTTDTEICLTGLNDQQTRAMVTAAIGDMAGPEDLVRSLVARADGIPLFVEELTRAVAEDRGPEAMRRIPSTLHDSLMARLDRLGPAKEVAQVGAVVGHEFSYELVKTLSRFDERELQVMLARLVAAGLLDPRESPAGPTYVFRHALIRDTAYEALLHHRRRELHQKVARTICEQWPAIATAQPETLAHHYTEARDRENALTAWQRAAKNASARGALVEAEGYYHRALAVLRTMEQKPARDQLEMVLQLGLGQVSIATRGYMAPATAAAYGRARALGERLGDARRAVQVLAGLCAVPLLQGEMRAAQELAEQVTAAARRAGGAAGLCWGYYLEGVAGYHRGDLAIAKDRFDSAYALYREADHSGNPQDPGTESLEYGALTAWQMGLADTACLRMGEALALAGRLKKPYALAHGRFYAAFMHALRRDHAATREYAETVVVLTQERRFPHFFSAGKTLWGWALSRGTSGEFLAHVRDGLNDYAASGNRLAIGAFLGFLAESYAQAGAFHDALRTIGEALEGAREQLVDHPYLLWQRGEILLRAAASCASVGSPAEMAEQSFRQALALAERLGARYYALRAATSLARQLMARGQGHEARELLAAALNPITQGFDTSDVREAQALMGESGGRR